MKNKYTRYTPPYIRFWGNVTKTNGCWEWQACTRAGYGVIVIGGERISAHRLSYELHIGMIPEGMCVLHKCDNKICVNPKHLFLGTLNDNNQDMVMKNRNSKTYSRPLHKLTWEQVHEIRSLKGTISQRNLAKTYGVTKTAISQVHHNKTWIE